MHDEWLTLREGAAYGKTSIKTLRRRIADGSLPAARFGPQLIRVRRSDLDRLMRRIPAAGRSA